jgi:hypothetical protein
LLRDQLRHYRRIATRHRERDGGGRYRLFRHAERQSDNKDDRARRVIGTTDLAGRDDDATLREGAPGESREITGLQFPGRPCQGEGVRF